MVEQVCSTRLEKYYLEFKEMLGSSVDDEIFYNVTQNRETQLHDQMLLIYDLKKIIILKGIIIFRKKTKYKINV